MKRVEIRNKRSEKAVKPRVFDAIIDDSGEITLEVKNSKSSETIPLMDVIRQIREAQ